MAFPQGVYFRSTDNQTDPTNYDADISTTANYPTATAQGNNVGWEQAPAGVRDRGGTGAVELRGIAFQGNATSNYRIDLPSAGTYTIRAAFGDQGSNQSIVKAELLDDSTVFATPLNLSSMTAGQFVDAAGTLHTSQANWTANNASIQNTFTSTIFRIRIGVTGGNTPMAAIYIEGPSTETKILHVVSSPLRW